MWPAVGSGGGPGRRRDVEAGHPDRRRRPGGLRRHQPRPPQQVPGTYRVIRATSGPEALEALTTLALRGQQVALIASDQRMPGMSGIELLEQAMTHAPEAKRLLLTAHAEDVTIPAMTDIGLDHS